MTVYKFISTDESNGKFIATDKAIRSHVMTDAIRKKRWRLDHFKISGFQHNSEEIIKRKDELRCRFRLAKETTRDKAKDRDAGKNASNHRQPPTGR